MTFCRKNPDDSQNVYISIVYLRKLTAYLFASLDEMQQVSGLSLVEEIQCVHLTIQCEGQVQSLWN